MPVDILYLAFQRREFTQFTFTRLLENTDWDLVGHLYVHDDWSTDGTRRWLQQAVLEAPVPFTFKSERLGGPVEVMNRYISDRGDQTDRFAKIDNDIVVDDRWLNRLVETTNRHPHIDLLGSAVGFGVPETAQDVDRGWMEARFIGGVGLMRTKPFLDTHPMPAQGRFGFTAWQEKHEPVRGWLCPPSPLFQLDLVPREPWVSLTRSYVGKGWQRQWPPYKDPTIWKWAL